MRWLLLKDLQILRRSPLLVALLVLYPIVVAVLIGLALSRGPDRPTVAFLNQVPASQEQIDLGGQQVDLSKYSEILFQRIDPVPVSSRAEALQKIRDGRVVGALVIPPDIAQKLESGLEPAMVEVLYNAEDPVKARYLEDTIRAQLQQANSALSGQLTDVALRYIGLLVRGGQVSFLGRQSDVLGLERSEQILREAKARLPDESPVRGQLDQVIDFAGLARGNLDLADEALASVGSPLQVKSTLVAGAPSSLSSFAVAVAAAVTLMFVTLLLAAGMLALEREENAFRRLVRGLVSRTGLLVEKIGLAAACSVLVALLMLLGLALFVELDVARIGFWTLALTAGALAFAAMGVAIGALAREVRAASLLAFMISLPIAFLALVPSGSVSAGLYQAIRVVSAAFPFEPTLAALQAALGSSGTLAGPLVHLALLTLGFATIGRLALRRFA